MLIVQSELSSRRQADIQRAQIVLNGPLFSTRFSLWQDPECRTGSQRMVLTGVGTTEVATGQRKTGAKTLTTNRP